MIVLIVPFFEVPAEGTNPRCPCSECSTPEVGGKGRGIFFFAARLARSGEAPRHTDPIS